MTSTSALTIYVCAITDSSRATLSCVLEDAAASITRVTGISFRCRVVGVGSCAPLCELTYRMVASDLLCDWSVHSPNVVKIVGGSLYSPKVVKLYLDRLFSLHKYTWRGTAL